MGDALEVYQPVDRTLSNNFALNTDLTVTTAGMNGRTGTISGAISGSSNLIVQGATSTAADQLILSGTNTYDGSTTVMACAKLLMSGGHTNAAEYIVNANGVLIANGPLSVTTSATPTTPSDLSITNDGTASFGIASNLQLDLFSNLPGADGASGAAPENDEVIVGGAVSLTLGGTLTVRTVTITSYAPGDRWDLFDWLKAPTGTFATVVLPTLPANRQWNTSDLYVGGTISIVPEPSTLAFLACFAGTALLRRRRR